MGILWSRLIFTQKKVRLSWRRHRLQLELDRLIAELHGLGVWDQQALEQEKRRCHIVAIQLDSIVLSGGLRIERDPLFNFLKEGDVVVVARQGALFPWKISIDSMEVWLDDSSSSSSNPEIIEVDPIDEELFADGKVIGLQENSWVVVDPEKYSFKLSDVKCSFTPAAGDSICITVSGSKIKFISPMASIIVEASVSYWNGKMGQIAVDSEEYASFTLAECDTNYVPFVGDLVAAKVIDNSANEHLIWRAVKITLLKLAVTRGLEDPEITELLQNSSEISTGAYFDCGKFQLGQKGRAMPMIKNTSDKPHILTGIHPCTKVSQTPQFKLVSDIVFPIKLEKGESIVLSFECQPKEGGQWRDLIVFDFDLGKLRIGRFFTVEVYDPAQLRNRDNYSRKRRLVGDDSKMTGQVVKADRNLKANPFRRRVQKIVLPDNIKELVHSLESVIGRENIALALKDKHPVLMEELDEYNYTQKFKLLLHLEEAEARKGMEKFNLRGVMLRKESGDEGFFSVPSEFLSERRPSVIVGDTVQVQLSERSPIYEGYVEETTGCRIKFKLSTAFPKSMENQPINVNFLISQSNFKFQHAAIEEAWKSLGDQVLFPTCIDLAQDAQVEISGQLAFTYSGNTDVPNGGWFNPNLNPSQRGAVFNILLGIARPLPYVIFGPPGTGKTVTLIEAVLQIHRLVPGSKILVATPSNSAADLVAEKLISAHQTVMRPGVLIRLVAFNYRKGVPSYLQPYAVIVKVDGSNDISKSFTKSRIIVGTCSSLARLCVQQARCYYSHIFVDEAGQASEPEAMCAVALLGKPKQIILAGDPKQLGPVIMGRIAGQAGLGESWLSRLLKCPLYTRQPNHFSETQDYNPKIITMLTVNYRTLPEILNIPSQLFYNSLLKPMVTKENSREGKLLQALANELPRGSNGPPALVFHGLKGQCRRDSDSPSWYNPQECTQVFTYVQKLLGIGVQPWDIGIITFYAKQSAKMRELLRSNSILGIKVGSVEEFQGQERLVVILSTVRKLETKDDSMGFMSNPNRINVALTRARALLLLVGDPHMLATDRHWRAVLEDCVRRSAYVGCHLPFNNIHNNQQSTLHEPAW